MNSNNIVYLSPKCHQLSNYGKDFTDAYIFVKQLSAGLTHPVLLNFTANKDAHRLKLRMGHQRFNRLLKSATSHRLASYSGNNLQLITHTDERKLFGINSANNYEPVKIEHVKQFIQIHILKHNVNKQKGEYIANQKSTAKTGSGNVTVLNDVPTLSSRNAAKLLNLNSYTYAANLLTKLKPFGLTLTQNRVQTTAQQYVEHKGTHYARYDKIDGNYYFIGANLPSFSSFYSNPLTQPVKSSFYDRMLEVA